MHSPTFSENLTLGGGIGIRSQLEDDALFYPIIIVDWQITDRLSFDTRLTTGWANQSGAELVYELTEDLDVGIAAVCSTTSGSDSMIQVRFPTAWVPPGRFL